jgi:hypothetical protein
MSRTSKVALGITGSSAATTVNGLGGVAVGSHRKWRFLIRNDAYLALAPSCSATRQMKNTQLCGCPGGGPGRTRAAGLPL